MSVTEEAGDKVQIPDKLPQAQLKKMEEYVHNGDNNQPQKFIHKNPRVGVKDPIEFQSSIKRTPASAFTKLNVGIERKICLVNSQFAATWSPFFSELFQDKSYQHDSGIDLPDLTPETVESFINFLVFGEIEINEDIAPALLMTAQKFKLDDIYDKCLDFLIHHITPNNCLKYRDFAIEKGVGTLFAECNLFLSDKLHLITKSVNFLKLPVADIEHVISSFSDGHFRIGANLECIVHWVQHDEVERVSSLPSLIDKVDLKKLKDENAKVLQSFFEKGTLLAKHPYSSEKYFRMCEAEMIEYARLVEDERLKVTLPKATQTDSLIIGVVKAKKIKTKEGVLQVENGDLNGDLNKKTGSLEPPLETPVIETNVVPRSNLKRNLNVSLTNCELDEENTSTKKIKALSSSSAEVEALLSLGRQVSFTSTVVATRTKRETSVPKESRKRNANLEQSPPFQVPTTESSQPPASLDQSSVPSTSTQRRSRRQRNVSGSALVKFDT